MCIHTTDRYLALGVYDAVWRTERMGSLLILAHYMRDAPFDVQIKVLVCIKAIVTLRHAHQAVVRAVVFLKDSPELKATRASHSHKKSAAEVGACRMCRACETCARAAAGGHQCPVLQTPCGARSVLLFDAVRY